MVDKSDLKGGCAAGLHGSNEKIVVVLGSAFSQSDFDVLSQLSRNITKTPGIAANLLRKPENNLKVPSFLSMRSLDM
ncbi:MAG: hypothetical protein KAJ40_05795 [Alphaproteobacteria bacterium]|nr:hypothetical protein [Alphaproteobacteria bacterium]